jgi:hypothetical protein
MGAIHAKRERMKAGLRLVLLFWAGAFAVAPVTAPAQDVPQDSDTSAPGGVIGPQELQNFNLQGRVTRPSEPPAEQRPAPARPAHTPQVEPTGTVTGPDTRASRQRAAETSRRAPADAHERRAEISTPAGTAAAATHAPEPLRQTPPASSVTVALPSLDNGKVRSSAAAAPPVAAAGLDGTGTLAPERKVSLFPWLLAALALGAGGAFLFWRSRSREAVAGGPPVDAFAAPEPVFEPQPAPAPPPKQVPPAIGGVVSTRLRPWVEIVFSPSRCIVEDDKVTFEFDLELLNSGNAPARAVLVEATLFNASNDQEQELGAFFAKPVGQGERIPAIQPLKRVQLSTRVVTARDHVQVYDIGGRKVFVPILAFNALYRWTGGEGQTSASYLLGIDTKHDKMAPFRLDLGRRVFQSVTARLLPTGVRS